ncbi:MAG: NUDIX domain-containing protein [Methylophilaceae bacterium]
MKSAELKPHFSAILSCIADAKKGLSKPIFLFLSQLTPMVNVDLLIKNEKGQTLLTWRHDEYYGPGWHIPGGIVRFKELASDRIKAVAQAELSAIVTAGCEPICVREIMAPHRDVRGHFISLLYKCELISALDETKAYITDDLLSNGQWKWHDACPDNLIAQHQMYRPFMKDEHA